MPGPKVEACPTDAGGQARHARRREGRKTPARAPPGLSSRNGRGRPTRAAPGPGPGNAGADRTRPPGPWLRAGAAQRRCDPDLPRRPSGVPGRDRARARAPVSRQPGPAGRGPAPRPMGQASAALPARPGRDGPSACPAAARRRRRAEAARDAGRPERTRAGGTPPKSRAKPRRPGARPLGRGRRGRRGTRGHSRDAVPAVSQRARATAACPSRRAGGGTRRRSPQLPGRPGRQRRARRAMASLRASAPAPVQPPPCGTGGHPARPGLRLLARKETPRPRNPSEASLRTRRPRRTAPLPGVPNPPPWAVVFPGTAGRFVRMPRRPARLAAARAASVEGRIREGPHPSGRPVRRVPRGQPRSGRSRLPGRPRHGERRRRRSLCPCRRGTQSGTAPGGGPPCPVLRTSSGRFPPPAAPDNPWRLRPATPPGRTPVACRPSRGSSGTGLPAGPALAPAARPCLPCRHSGQDIRPQRCICPEPSGQPARGLPRECPGIFCRGRAPPPAGAARRPSRAAAEGVAGQASPSVSISAAASASGPVFPPHRTNWKTG